jgi:lipoprotein-anchoring transpeptidase ErfK/SrfK
MSWVVGLSAKRLIGAGVLLFALASPAHADPDLTEISRLEVNLTKRQVVAFVGTQKLKTFQIGVGKKGWETPTGNFKVKQLIENPAWKNPFTGDVIAAGDRDNPLGKHWIGFWTNGKEWSGFHGTSQLSSVGQASSHGCLRMKPEEIKEIFAQVNLNTIVNVSR